MKIIIISGVAPPEPVVAGRVHWDIGQHLAGNGNEVWLISPYPTRPLGTNYIKHNYDSVSEISNNFFHVKIKSYTCPEYRLFGRLHESFDFGIKSISYVNKNLPGYDLIYVSSWAFLGQLMILLLRKTKKIPLIMNVQDLYPESFFNKIKSNVLSRLLKPLYLIDKFIAGRSTHLTVVSETLKQVYLKSRKIPESKITVLCNWQDESEFLKPVPNRDTVINQYGLDSASDKFIYMYLGNIGPVAGIDMVIEAFSTFHDGNSILIIAGSGTYKEHCIELAQSRQLNDVFFVTVPQGLGPVVELQSISDVLLLPIIPEGANSSIPSKLIAYMFSAKPIITSANPESETAGAITGSHCGWITRSHTPQDWAAAMMNAFNTDRLEINRMGRAGFDYAMQNHSKQNGLKRAEELFCKVANDSK